MPNPKRRNLDFRSFDAVVADIDRLHTAGYEPVGSWNLGQVCDHLAQFMNASLDGFSFKMPWYVRMLRPLIFRHLMKTRRMPEGIKGPPTLMPKNTAGDANAVEAMKRAITRVTEPAATFAPSPLFGHLPPDTWRELHLIHASHHLSFLLPREALR